MDFWQLDDIFELLGQNESLHGKRTVVFCLSLSPPQRLPLGIPIKIENDRKYGKHAGDQHKQASAKERVSLASHALQACEARARARETVNAILTLC